MPRTAIDSLMTLGSPRADGDSSAPLMRAAFSLPGLPGIQTPRDDGALSVSGQPSDYLPTPRTAIDSLMSLGAPRYTGNSSAPLMRYDFAIPGLMMLQTPKADADALLEVGQSIIYAGMTIRYGSLTLTYDETPRS